MYFSSSKRPGIPTLLRCEQPHDFGPYSTLPAQRLTILCSPSCIDSTLRIQLKACLATIAVHGPKDATPSEELVAIAAASAAAAAAHTTQMSQGTQGQVGQPSMASLQQEQEQHSSPARGRPGQADAEVLNRLCRLQQSQPPQV